MPIFNTDYPIILGLAGSAGSGKTSTADAIAPLARVNDDSELIVWNHISFALPLYQMVAARRKIEGAQRLDRIKYQLHATLLEVFGENPIFGAPPYPQLVELVTELASLPVSPEGTKPREFLQHAGDLCREVDPNCFASWARRRALKLYREHRLDELQYGSEHGARPFGVVISDVRFPNEARMILDQPNGVLVRLDASPATRQARIEARDGNAELALLRHASETSLADIPEEWFDYVVDTDAMTLSDQITRIKMFVNLHFQGALHA